MERMGATVCPGTRVSSPRRKRAAGQDASVQHLIEKALVAVGCLLEDQDVAARALCCADLFILGVQRLFSVPVADCMCRVQYGSHSEIQRLLLFFFVSK